MRSLITDVYEVMDQASGPTLTENNRCSACDSSLSEISSSSRMPTNAETSDNNNICESCGRQYTHESDADNSKYSALSPDIFYDCKDCGKRLQKKLDVDSHQLLVHCQEKVYVCDVCKQQFDTLSAVRNHMDTHISVRTYKCDLCGKHIKNESDAVEHVMSEHSGEEGNILLKEIIVNLGRYTTVADSNLGSTKQSLSRNNSRDVDGTTGNNDSDEYQAVKIDSSNLGCSPDDLGVVNDKNAGAITSEVTNPMTSESATNEKIFTGCEVSNKFGTGDDCAMHPNYSAKGEDNTNDSFDDSCDDFDNPLTEAVEEDTVARESRIKSMMASNIKLFLKNNSKDSVESKKDKVGLSRLTCEICLKTLKCASSFKAHLKIHDGIKPYMCDVCNKTFRKKSHLTEHRFVHEPVKRENGHVCNVCHKSFHNLGGLRRHLQIHINLRPHVCEICSKAFRKVSHLKEHAITHNKDRYSLHCEICGATFAHISSYRRHMNTHIFGHQFECSVCEKQFRSRSELNRHARRKHIKTEIVKTSNSVSEKSEGNMNVSKKSDEKEGMSKKIEKNKDVFKKGKDNKRVLKKGDRKAISEKTPKRKTEDVKKSESFRKLKKVKGKKNKCDLCRKTLRTSEGYEKHMKRHAEEKPFMCEVCNKIFKRKDYLRDHQRTHDENREQFYCKQCSKNYNSQKSLMNHLREHHHGKQFKFEKCEKSFQKQALLIDHVNTSHKSLNTKGKRKSEGQTASQSVNEQVGSCSDKHAAPLLHGSANLSKLNGTVQDKIINTAIDHSAIDDIQKHSSGRKQPVTSDKEILTKDLTRTKPSAKYCKKDQSENVLFENEKCADKTDEHKEAMRQLDSLTNYGNNREVDFMSDYSSAVPKTDIDNYLEQIRLSEATNTASTSSTLPVYLLKNSFVHDDARKQLDKTTQMKKAKKEVEMSLICDTCGLKCSSYYSLTRHVKYGHTEKKMFMCEICGASYKQPDRLRNHIKKCREGDSGSRSTPKIHVLKFESLL